MKNQISYYFILATVLFSCNSGVKNADDVKTGSYPLLEKASWLVGEWEINLDRGTAIEIWEKANDSVYAGRSFFISGKDTIPGETVNLEQTGDGLFYIPTVKDQNKGEAVRFTLTSSRDRELIFENPAHDFPQKISYAQISKDSLLAEVSGMIKGKLESEKYQMKRVK